MQARLTPGVMARSGAVSATERLLRLARELNMLRPPDHRERIAQAVAVTREYFRPNPESDLPAPGADALLDGVQELASACEASPQAFEQACAHLERLEQQEDKVS